MDVDFVIIVHLSNGIHVKNVSPYSLSQVEHSPDKTEVLGSNPSTATNFMLYKIDYKT